MTALAGGRGAVQRTRGFCRFAFSVQYHGGSFLGVTYQGPEGEDCLRRQPRRRKLEDGKANNTVDLRGYRSVEGRLREALNDLFGEEQWENIQASSRTDRGVHALKNTFHVDIKTSNNSSNTVEQRKQDEEYEKIERKLRDGLNFYLSRQSHGFLDNHQPRAKQNPTMNELRILNAAKSPERMDNPYALTPAGRGQPMFVDWNARFSATQRTYVYRLVCHQARKPKRRTAGSSSALDFHEDDESSTPDVSSCFGIPFEWDRAWCLPMHQDHPLDLRAMAEAAEHLVGTHDFSSFRGRLCQRHSPIVRMKSVTLDHHHGFITKPNERPRQQLVTLTFVANSFLYRQVRNMVGCLVEVGKHGGRLTPGDVRDLVANEWKHEREKDRETEDQGSNHVDSNSSQPLRFRNRPYSTAPPQGLFLVDVQHGDFRF